MTEPPEKRARLTAGDVSATALLKAKLPPACDKLTASAPWGSLIAASEVTTTTASAFIANGCTVTRCSISLVSVPPPQQGKVSRNQSDTIIPTPGQVTATGVVCHHNGPVQSLTCAPRNGRLWIASVDCHGTVLVTHGAGEDEEFTTHRTLRPAHLNREPGWAGVAASQDDPDCVVVVRHYARDVTFFRGDAAASTYYTAHSPTAVVCLADTSMTNSASALCAVTEGHVVSVWDSRLDAHQACVARLLTCSSGSTLFAASLVPANPSMLAASGSDRAVVFWDVRTSALTTRWAPCVKHSITHIDILQESPDYAIVGGHDLEVLCAKWPKSKQGSDKTSSRKQKNAAQGAISFRGDSPWLGLSKAPDQDVIMGLTSAGFVYISAFKSAK